MDETAKTEEPRFVGIHCLGKWKRTLLHLGDFFIVFLLALLLFHIGVYPLGRVIVNYDGQLSSLHQAQQSRDEVLYGYELLFAKSEEAKTYDQFEENLVYTSETFAHCFVDTSISEKYDVFATYFINIRADQPAYITLFTELDKGYGFFDIQGNSVTLKPLYVERFAPKWNPDDTMSEQGKKDYQTFEDKIFTQAYSRMLNDIMEKDLQRGEVSYVEKQAVISRVLQNGRMLVVACVLFSFFFMWVINHMLIPTLSKKRKTLGMMMMRIERIHKDTYAPLSLPMGYLSAFYAMAGEALCVLFIPWGTINFNELFSLPLLFPIALISLAYVLGSLLMLLIDAYNRTLGDFLCNSYLLSEDEFDTLMREKGYNP